MEENHQVEIKGYIQKVKHLEYEHKNNANAVTNTGPSHEYSKQNSIGNES